MPDSFNTTFTVDRTPEEVFAAINAPQKWWNELIEGSADAVGDEFGFDMPGVHTTRMRVTEARPGQRVVWHVLENHFSFVEDQDEWLGTDVVFDITPAAQGTTVSLTHVGLVPEFQCYEVCSGAWTHHINAGLRALLASGNPAPMTAELAAQTAREFAAQNAHDGGRG
jgi:uncharacterized protein YndB with AHSA1/START domain